MLVDITGIYTFSPPYTLVRKVQLLLISIILLFLAKNTMGQCEGYQVLCTVSKATTEVTLCDLRITHSILFRRREERTRNHPMSVFQDPMERDALQASPVAAGYLQV